MRAGQTQCLGAATNVPADVARDESVFAFSALRFAGAKPQCQPCRSSFAASSSHLPACNRCCRGPACAIHSASVVQKFPLIVTMEISVVRLRLALPLFRSLPGNRRAEIPGHLRPQDCQSLWVASGLGLQQLANTRLDSRLGSGVRRGILPIIKVSELVKLVRLPPLLLPLPCVLPRGGLQLS